MRKFNEKQLNRSNWLTRAELYATQAEEALNQLLSAMDWAFDDKEDSEIDDYYESIDKHRDELERLNEFLEKEQEKLRKEGVRE